MIRKLALASAWSLLLSAHAGNAADFLYATVAPEVPRVQRSAEADEAEIPFLVVRQESGNGLGMILLLDEVQGSAAGYEFRGTPAANCLPARAVIDRRGRPAVGLPVLVPQDTDRISCTYRIRRLAGSRDMRLSLCPTEFSPSCGYELLPTPTFVPHVYTVGDVPDFSIRVEPAQLIPRGAQTALVRVVATNPTALDVRHRQFMTECAEFGGGIVFPAPFEIENDFPGACPTDAPYYGTECVLFDFDTSTRRLFRVENLPPHGEASCLLKLRFVAPLQRGFVGLPIYARNQLPYLDHGTAFDVDRASDVAPLGAGPADPPVPVPAGDSFWFALLGCAVPIVTSLWIARNKRISRTA